MRALACLALAACGGGAANLPPPSKQGNDPTLLVVDTAAAARYAIREEKLEIPFGQRESGTRLVLALMELAQEKNAAWVGGLEFLQVFKLKGQLVECATPVTRASAAATGPAAAPVAAAPSVETGPDGQPIYSSAVGAPTPQIIGATVSEDVIHCQRHGQARVVSMARYPSHYDVEVARVRDQSRRDPMLWTKWQDVCTSVRETHHVNRWDFQIKLEWTPPDWALIASRWADEPLVDGRPTCYRVESREVGEPPRHRMRARLFYRSAFRDSGVEPPTPLQEASRH